MLTKIKFIFYHKEVHNFINYYIFTIINAAVSIFSISFLTKHIVPEDYGRIGIYTSILFFLPSLMSFSANGLQAIEIVDLKAEAYLKFRNSYISFVLLSFGLTLLVSVLSSLYFREFAFVIIMATVMGFIQTLSSVHNTELFQYSQPTRFGLISTGTVSLGFLLTFLFISVFNLDWKSRIFALLISEFLFVIIRFYVLSSIGKSFNFVFDKIQFRYFIRYGAPLMFSVMGGWVISQSDRYFLLNYFSLKEVGLYSAAAGIASFIVVINSNMIKVVYPLVYKKLSKREGKKFILRLTLLYSILILIISILFCLGLYFFGHFFLGEKYQSAMPIIYIMCFAQAFFGIYTTTALVIDYFKMTKIKTILVLLSAGLVVVTTFVLIPLLGVFGPVFSTLFSYIFLAVLSFCISLTLFKKHKIL